MYNMILIFIDDFLMHSALAGPIQVGLVIGIGMAAMAIITGHNEAGPEDDE